MGAAMNIRVGPEVILRYLVENHSWLLSGSGIIEINQWFSVYLLVEDGKILSNLPEIETHNMDKITEPGMKLNPAHSRLMHRVFHASEKPGFLFSKNEMDQLSQSITQE
jgi:hypothetical protein